MPGSVFLEKNLLHILQTYICRIRMLFLLNLLKIHLNKSPLLFSVWKGSVSILVDCSDPTIYLICNKMALSWIMHNINIPFIVPLTCKGTSSSPAHDWSWPLTLQCNLYLQYLSSNPVLSQWCCVAQFFSMDKITVDLDRQFQYAVKTCWLAM